MILQDNDPTTGPSFTLRNRIARQIWQWCWLFLFRPSPRSMHAWRAMLLRVFGAELGEHVHVYPGVRVWAPWNLKVGNHVGVADGVTIYNMAPITIGDRCVVSQGAHLCCGTHDYNSHNFQLMALPISLGTNIWVCSEAFIGPGVKIADGVVVGARSVAIKSLSTPWAVYAGNPCRLTRSRRVIRAASTSTKGSDE